MPQETILFILVAASTFPLALLISHALVRWVLPQRLTVELGNSSRYVSIDGVRGYLAFGVFVHHYILQWIYLHDGRSGSPPLNFENQFGKTSVAVFFMITAFLFWGRANSKKKMDWKSFLVSRLFRIYPLYLVFILAICIGVGYRSHWMAFEPPLAIATEIFKLLFFRPPYINHYDGNSIGGVNWTLLYEAWFYLCLPLFVFIFLRTNAIWKKLVALGLAIALLLVNHLQPLTVASFIGGIAAVHWINNEKLLKIAQSNAATLVALGCLAYEGIFIYDPFNPLGIALLTVFFVTIASGNTLFGLLRIRAALWLGEISYSIYLIHCIILWVVMKNVLPSLPSFHPTLAWLAGSVICLTFLVVLLPSATYLYIERPFIALGHRLANRKPSQIWRDHTVGETVGNRSAGAM